jgi:hypothetical protein
MGIVAKGRAMFKAAAAKGAGGSLQKGRGLYTIIL